jgi:hypothetical protein
MLGQSLQLGAEFTNEALVVTVAYVSSTNIALAAYNRLTNVIFVVLNCSRQVKGQPSFLVHRVTCDGVVSVVRRAKFCHCLVGWFGRTLNRLTR